MNISEVLSARYNSVSLSGANAVNWRDALSTAAGLRDYAAQDNIIGARGAPIRTVDAKVFAVLDAITTPSFCSAGSLETIEVAIEDLRTTAKSLAIGDGKNMFDSEGHLIPTTTIVHASSVSSSYSNFSLPNSFDTGPFCKFRSACRRCYFAAGDDGVYDKTLPRP